MAKTVLRLSLAVGLGPVEAGGTKACKQGRFKTRRDLAEATPGTQNVLEQTSEAHGDSKLYDTIVQVWVELELIGNYAALLEF